MTNDLAELFARDPLELSKDDIRSIIEEMRKSRHAFNAGNAKQKTIATLADKMNISI
jgi:hypothetical protein